jgi:protein-tyrosine-phosphatase
MPTILFVCTANRYRSPIAAACFRRELELHEGCTGWRVVSAGTWAVDGMPAVADAVRQARGMGLDIASHVSRVITPDLMTMADLVIVMERGQKEALQVEFPGESHKVHLLSEADGQVYDIPDPIGLPGGGVVPQDIGRIIHGGFDRICELVK